MFQCNQDICEWMLGWHPQRSWTADEHFEETPQTDGHHRVRGNKWETVRSCRHSEIKLVQIRQLWKVFNYGVIDHSDCFRCQWSETSENERSESTLMLDEFAGHCWLLKNRNYCLRDDTLTSWRRESTTTTGEAGSGKSALLVSVDVTFAIFLWWVAGRTWWRVAWWSILTPWRRRLWCSPWPLMTFRRRVWHTAQPTHTVRFTHPWSLESVLLLFRSLTTTRYYKRNESTLTHNNSWVLTTNWVLNQFYAPSLNKDFSAGQSLHQQLSVGGCSLLVFCFAVS